MTGHPGPAPSRDARARRDARHGRAPMRPWHRWRLVANILNGSTLTGIVVASAGGARLRPAGDGLLVGAGYRLPVPPAPAFCVGNVLVTRLGYATFAGEVRLFTHEARHATQYACCGGVLMLPLYGIAAAVSWALCDDFGSRNVFEQRAGLADGGYTEKNLRPVLRRRLSRPARRRAGLDVVIRRRRTGRGSSPCPTPR